MTVQFYLFYSMFVTPTDATHSYKNFTKANLENDNRENRKYEIIILTAVCNIFSEISLM